MQCLVPVSHLQTDTIRSCMVLGRHVFLPIQFLPSNVGTVSRRELSAGHIFLHLRSPRKYSHWSLGPAVLPIRDLIENGKTSQTFSSPRTLNLTQISLRTMYNADVDFYRHAERSLSMGSGQASSLSDCCERPSHLSQRPTPTSDLEAKPAPSHRKRVPVAVCGIHSSADAADLISSHSARDVVNEKSSAVVTKAVVEAA